MRGLGMSRKGPIFSESSPAQTQPLIADAPSRPRKNTMADAGDADEVERPDTYAQAYMKATHCAETRAAPFRAG